MDGSVTAFDAVVLGVLLLSGLLALVRGFVREALSVAAFVAAALGALWMLPVLREPVRGVVQPDWAGDVAAVGGTFLLIFLAVTLVTSSIRKSISKDDEPGMLDRMGGLAFGVVRGLVLLAFFVIVYVAALPDRPSRWLTEARLYPLISSTALALQELAPESSRMAAAPPPPSSQAPSYSDRQTDLLDRLTGEATGDAAPEAEAEAEETAYGDTARAGLDQLIGANADEPADAPTQGNAQ